ncbi:MAG: DEAD/DEAH box helicase family protein [Burkholderiales bacterium]
MLDESRLWKVQARAIHNLEASLGRADSRALIQMATGSGKTFTAVNIAYRLLKFGGAKRILFLVDRGNLGKQAEDEFVNFEPPDDPRKFPTLYTVQRLKTNSINPAAKVVITTIQRLYSMLKGEAEFDEGNEEGSAFDSAKPWKGEPPAVAYNAGIPPEFFDFIVVDECHRSIYELWSQVLLYFDSFLIGLTATPAGKTIGFFNQNLVMHYVMTRRSPTASTSILMSTASEPASLRRVQPSQPAIPAFMWTCVTSSLAPSGSNFSTATSPTPPTSSTAMSFPKARFVQCFNNSETRCCPTLSPAAKKCLKRLSSPRTIPMPTTSCVLCAKRLRKETISARRSPIAPALPRLRGRCRTQMVPSPRSLSGCGPLPSRRTKSSPISATASSRASRSPWT